MGAGRREGPPPKAEGLSTTAVPTAPPIGCTLSGLGMASLLFWAGLECGNQILVSGVGGTHSTEVKGVGWTPDL